MKNKPYVYYLIIVLLVAAIFAGCERDKKEIEGVNDNSFKIVTSFYPVYVFTLNVADGIEGVSIVNMTEPQTGCLHDYQLTTKDMKTLEGADAFIINGADMESFIDKVIKQLSNLKIVDCSKNIELYKNKETNEANAHIWVSVSNAIVEVNNIAEELSKIDNKNADKYKQNAKEYIVKLESLKSKMHNELDTFKGNNIITFHEAFPYFAKEFNLNIATVIEREPGSEPSAGELRDTIDIINKNRVKALFAEPQYPTKAIDAIAKETGARVYVLDPVVTGPLNKEAYISIMEKNMSTLKEALK